MNEHNCEVCGCDLTDPKNRGDPDVNGDWVCSSPSCRVAHPEEMTCNIQVIGRWEPPGCPECDDGELSVADAVYAWCDNCDAEVERREVGL